MDWRPISADSHITEAPNTYIDYIDSKWADKAPRVLETEDRGDLYIIDGMKRTIPMGLVAAAGQDQARAQEFIGIMSRAGGLSAGKTIMKLIGVDCGPVRLPLTNLTRQQERTWMRRSVTTRRR